MAGTPFARALHTGPPMEQGKDVTAIQRALVKKKCLVGEVTVGAFAEKTWDAVAKYQKRKGIQPTGNYGISTHKALVADKGFDAYGSLLLTEAVQDLKPKPDPRDAIVRIGWWYYGQKWKMRYDQGRPIQTIWHGIRPPSLPRYLDCSGFCITTYWANGKQALLGDENAHGYGNTWSLAAHGTPVTVAQLQPGDFVFYYSDCHHVALYVGNDSVLSFGSYPMKYLPVGYASVWGCRSYLP